MNAQCCDKGVAWVGPVSGSDGQLGGLRTFISKPPQPTNKAAILISDAFGYDRINIRLLADAYAKAGYLTVVPDLLQGDSLTWQGMEHAHKWFASHPVGSDKTLEELGAVISELRSAHGIEHLVTEGFCWGGGYAAALAATDKVAAATIAHGSMMKLEQFEQLTQPTQLLCAEEDPQWPPEFLNDVTKALEGKDFPTSVKNFPGTSHGFAIRGEFGAEGPLFLEGDEKMDNTTTTAASEAAKDTIAWWDRHTGASAPAS